MLLPGRRSLHYPSWFLRIHVSAILIALVIY